MVYFNVVQCDIFYGPYPIDRGYLFAKNSRRVLDNATSDIMHQTSDIRLRRAGDFRRKEDPIVAIIDAIVSDPESI